jgi:hypothetical protein
MNATWIGRLSLLLTFVLLSGCARYRYFLVEPTQLAQEIPHKKTATVVYEPLRYEFTGRGDHLVMSIMNPAEDPVNLQARKSYVVTPDGQTRQFPVTDSAIAGYSYIGGIVFPPQFRVARSNPSFSFGLGYGYPHMYSSSHGIQPLYPGPVFGSPWYYEPAYYLDNVPIWGWKTGPVRMRLLFEQARGTNSVEHHLTIERRRVK